MSVDVQRIEDDREARLERLQEERVDRLNDEYDPDREAFWDEYGDAERVWRE